MSLDISLVLYGDIAKTIWAVMPYLSEAAARTKGRSSTDDIVRTIFTGQYALWVVFDKGTNRVHGCFVTEVTQFPQCKILTVQHCVIDANHMEPMEERMQEIASKYAADCGCTAISFVGRPGWKKHAEKYGYSANSVTYTKMLGAAP